MYPPFDEPTLLLTPVTDKAKRNRGYVGDATKKSECSTEDYRKYGMIALKDALVLDSIEMKQ